MSERAAERARVLEASGNGNGAIAELRDALESDCSRIDLKARLANLLADEGQADAAIKLWRDIEKAPTATSSQRTAAVTRLTEFEFLREEENDSEHYEPDIVVLKSGKTLAGRITKWVAGDRVVLLLADGRRPSVTWDLIKRVQSARFQFDPTSRLRDPSPPSGQRHLERSRTHDLHDLDGSHAPHARRKAWLKRGGSLVSYELAVQATGFIFPERSYSTVQQACYFPNGQPGQKTVTPAPTRDGGAGGAVGARVGYMYLDPPAPGKASLFAFRIAPGINAGYTSVITFAPAGSGYQPCSRPAPEAEQRSVSLTLFQVPVAMGVFLGLKGSTSVMKWSGVVLGLSWVPTYTYLVPEEGDGSGTLGLGGAEVSFDVTSLRATMEKQAPEPHFRFSALVIPPFDKNSPLIGTLGLGAVWY